MQMRLAEYIFKWFKSTLCSQRIVGCREATGKGSRSKIQPIDLVEYRPTDGQVSVGKISVTPIRMYGIEIYLTQGDLILI